MEAQITELETQGFYQETYRQRDAFFDDWNRGIWDHRWHLNKGYECALCGSTEAALRVGRVAVCLRCLTQYPLVPWHPTGAVRGKVTDLIRHVESCTSHSSLPTQPPLRYGGDKPA